MRIRIAGLLIVLVAGPLGAQSPDRVALEALYHATDGPNWTNSDGWLSAQPLGEWFGVDTYEGRVIELELLDNGLRGPLPSEIGFLTELNVLDLRWNYLYGEIPSALGNLSQLTDLWLTSNSFSGEIPAELGQLHGLTHLELSHNEWTDSIPPELEYLPNIEGIAIHRQHELPKGSFSGSDLIDESIRSLPESDYTRDIIERTMAAIHVRDGLLWVDPTALPDGLPSLRLAEVVEEMNQKLIQSGDRIETVDDLNRIIETYEGEGIEIEEHGPGVVPGVPFHFRSLSRPSVASSMVSTRGNVGWSDEPDLDVSNGQSSFTSYIAYVSCSTLKPHDIHESWDNFTRVAKAKTGGLCVYVLGPHQLITYRLQLALQIRIDRGFFSYYDTRERRNVQTKYGYVAIWDQNDDENWATSYCNQRGNRTWRSKIYLYVTGTATLFFPYPATRNGNARQLNCT